MKQADVAKIDSTLNLYKTRIKHQFNQTEPCEAVGRTPLKFPTKMHSLPEGACLPFWWKNRKFSSKKNKNLEKLFRKTRNFKAPSAFLPGPACEIRL